MNWYDWLPVSCDETIFSLPEDWRKLFPTISKQFDIHKPNRLVIDRYTIKFYKGEDPGEYSELLHIIENSEEGFLCFSETMKWAHVILGEPHNVQINDRKEDEILENIEIKLKEHLKRNLITSQDEMINEELLPFLEQRMDKLRIEFHLFHPTIEFSILKKVHAYYKNKKKNEEIKYENIVVVSNRQILKAMYDELNEHYIDKINRDLFLEHFLTNNPNLTRINQIGYRYDFIYLFDHLTKYFNRAVLHSYRGNDRCDKWLSEHFTFEGEKINAKNISTSRAKSSTGSSKNLVRLNFILRQIDSFSNE